ncbi:hypothetical protein [Clostridium sp. E02]|uniref:hypothetical protein n=1 Tax=Clostridium sp. E02 TaxID=2487134 RepID=UPI000F53B410|nr:hypothetical protein [Clostridium sp. E02]
MLRKIYSSIILAFFLMVVLLAGCAGKEKPKATKEMNKTELRSAANPREEAISEVSTEEETVIETEQKDEKLEAFAEIVQEAVSDRNLEALSDLLSYPCKLVTVDQEIISLKNKEDLIKQNPDLVFGDDLMIAIANVDTATLKHSGNGVVLGEDSSYLIFHKMEAGDYGIKEIRE